jgi:hypothetical protein
LGVGQELVGWEEEGREWIMGGRRVWRWVESGAEGGGMGMRRAEDGGGGTREVERGRRRAEEG